MEERGENNVRVVECDSLVPDRALRVDHLQNHRKVYVR